MTFFKKTSAVLLCAAVFAILFSFPAFSKAEKAIAAFDEPRGRMLIVSSSGSVAEDAPENTVKSVKRAFEEGADIVAVDLSKTADGRIILFRDKDTKRMCGADMEVEKTDLNTLSSLPLLSFDGGHYAKETKEKIVTLEVLLKKVPGGVFLFRGADEFLKDAVDILKSEGSLDRSIFLLKAQDEKRASSASAENGGVRTMTRYKGNIIFCVASRLINASKYNIRAISFNSKVPYGVVFSYGVGSFAKKKGIRTMADLTVAEFSGKLRRDAFVWYDDLVSRGFSMILTHDVKNLKAYNDSRNERRHDLQATYDELVKDKTLPDFKSNVFRKYKRRYDKAKNEALAALGDPNASMRAIDDAIYSLKSSFGAINDDYVHLKNGTAGLTVTPGRILAAVLAAAGFVFLEVFIYKRTDRREEKTQTEANN